MAVDMKLIVIVCSLGITCLVEAGIPKLKDLPMNEFTQHEVGGNTLCGDGSPFYVYIKRGDSERLVIDFEGGGGCLDYESCFGENTPFGVNNDDAFGPFESELVGTIGESEDYPANTPPSFSGPSSGPTDFLRFADRSVVFNPDLPTVSWTTLYVPYCTQDVGLGSNNATYFKIDPATGQVQDVRWFNHNGMANTQAALNWVKDNFKRGKVKEILSTGCSAGSVTAAYATTQLEEHYIRHRHGGDRNHNHIDDSEEEEDDKSDSDSSDSNSEPSLTCFTDSYYLINTPLFTTGGYNWGFDCTILELLGDIGVATQDFYTDADNTRDHLGFELFFEAAAKKAVHTNFMMYGAMVDVVSEGSYDSGNPSFPVAPGVEFKPFPDDMYQIRFRSMFARLEALDNVAVYVVNDYTQDGAELQSNPTLLLGSEHCSVLAGTNFFAYLSANTHAFYSTTTYEDASGKWAERAGIALFPWYGFNPNLPNLAGPDAVEWFITGLTAHSTGVMPASYVAPECMATPENGCAPGTSEFHVYNGCGSCTNLPDTCLPPLETFTEQGTFDFTFFNKFFGAWFQTQFQTKNVISLARQFEFSQNGVCAEPTPPKRQGRRNRRGMFAGVGVAAAAVVLGVGGGMVYRRRRLRRLSQTAATPSSTPLVLFGKPRKRSLVMAKPAKVTEEV